MQPIRYGCNVAGHVRSFDLAPDHFSSGQYACHNGQATFEEHIDPKIAT